MTLLLTRHILFVDTATGSSNCSATGGGTDYAIRYAIGTVGATATSSGTQYAIFERGGSADGKATTSSNSFQIRLLAGSALANASTAGGNIGALVYAVGGGVGVALGTHAGFLVVVPRNAEPEYRRRRPMTKGAYVRSKFHGG